MHFPVILLSFLTMMALTFGCASTSTNDSGVAKSDGFKSDRAKAQSMNGGYEVFARLLDVESSLRPEDETFVLSLKKDSKNGSFSEAVKTVYIFRKAILQREAKATDMLSLEALALENGIDLAKALSKNPMLRSYPVHSLCVQALSANSISERYRTQILASVAEQISLWGGLQVGPGSPAATSTTSNSNSSNSTPSAKPNMATLKSGDTLLIEAQNLADNKRYVEAINRANQIQADNPLYQAAQSRIIAFSNEAVQDLRQKAAQSFQSALPVADPRARSNFLEQAKTHLERALTEFPNASEDQLKTIKENLSVITKDLERK